MSGLAQFLLGSGVTVSGSDIAPSHITDKLVEQGAQVFIGHSAEHIQPGMTVIFSTDIKTCNPEYRRASDLNCPILHRSDLLDLILSDKKALTVSGTHGKTTTSSLLAWVLSQSGADPSCIIGGIIADFNSNSRAGKGEYFVAEADESDGSFLKYTSWGAIVTNIGLDHMSFYKNERALVSAFHDFTKKILSPDHLFWCGDDPRLVQLNLSGVPYGTGDNSILRAANLVQIGWKILFDVHFEGKLYPQVEVALIGKHNALNALAVFGMALKIGLEERDIRAALKSFRGVLRRCEKKGEGQGILVIDDYGHHPTEIQTTLEGIREAIGKKRLIAVFQPHRYTRTRDCLGTYGSTFKAADLLLLTDIYGGGEEPIPGITHEVLMKELRHSHPGSLFYFHRNEIEEQLHCLARPQDVIVTLGAGDLNKVSASFAKSLES